MSGKGAGQAAPPVAWCVLSTPHLAEGACTLRWQRGDAVAVVLRGRHMGRWGTAAEVYEQIRVPTGGWTDAGEVRQVLTRWLAEHLNQQRQPR